MDIQILLNIPVIIGISIIALLVFLRRGNKGETYFAAFAGLVALWLSLQFVAQLDLVGETGGLRLLQAASFVANFMVYAFLLFVAAYTKSSFINKGSTKILAFLPLAVLVLASFTPLMIREATVSSSGIAIKDAGILYFVQLILFVLYFGFSIILLVRDTLKKPPRLRSPNYLLIIALSQAVLLGILASSLFASSDASQILIPIGLFIMISLISYGIIRQGLFDIRLVVVRSLAYFLVLATLTAFFVIVIFVTSTNFATEQMSLVTEVFYIIVALIVASVFQTLKRFFDRITNKLFYQNAYDPQLVLNTLNQILVSTLDVKVLLSHTVEILETNIKTEYGAFVISEASHEHDVMVGAGRGIPTSQAISRVLKDIPELSSKVIITDSLGEDGHSELRNFLLEKNIAALVRLTSSIGAKEELGFLLLGLKKNGSPFSRQDIRMLEIIGNELVIAIQNALRFEEIQNFNVKLAQEVEDATYRLRKTNEKLVALDEAKDEFISMASHQLRTPLTSVKGYLSMVLEGDAGKLNPKEKKLLNQAFASSQRMVYLISDLLNLSRLKTGKFVIEPNPVNLAEVIGGEVDQLIETAASHNLKLTYNKPKDFPTLMFDETKIRQVIMNFIDNAIHYTPSGGQIDVRLEDHTHTVEFTVTDTGIGVSKHEQHNLFTKFFRAGNAKKARPDGTGLGLYMAKKIIIAQGGSVIFKSAENRGSTFGFTFSKAKLRPTEAAVVDLTAKPQHPLEPDLSL